MLSEVQWSWFEGELSKRSEVKIIVSGIQVLPPTDLSRNVEEYCAYDSAASETTFMDAIEDVDEGQDHGSKFFSKAKVQ